MRKRIGTSLVVSLGLILAGCGSSRSGSGSWQATLTNPDGSTAYTFAATIAQNGNTLSFPSLFFTNPGSCSALTLAGGSGTVGNGSTVIKISSGLANPEATILKLNGSWNGNTSAGTWTLNGSVIPCNGNGTFMLFKKPADTP